MFFRNIVKMFDKGNVCVCGLRGNGKDMLMSNVVVRRKKPYVSNVDYGGEYRPFNPLDYDTKNTYKNFIEGNLNPYVYPHLDGTDIYISDGGVYFPSQYCSQLDKSYGGFTTFMALSRHIGACNVHANVQNLNRLWTKIVEQSDLYIFCNRCIVLFGKITIQVVTLYEMMDSCIKRVPPFSMKRPMMNKDRIQRYEIAREQYRCTHGKVDRRLLVYWHKSNYDTRIFKTLLAPKEVNIDGKAISDDPFDVCSSGHS